MLCLLSTNDVLVIATISSPFRTYWSDTVVFAICRHVRVDT
jgi:hypothetical protein